jgi:NodT family efflux transporter outer membrane factor (OMF) lipoprotein
MHAIHRSLKAGALTLLAAALAACTTVGPDYRVPDNAVVKRPAAQAPFAGAAEATYNADPLPADWWRLYQDPTLDALIKKAFAANADLRVAAANLERAHAALEEVEEKRRPEVDVAVAPQYGRIAGAALGIPEQLPRTGLYEGDIKVSYQVDMWGRIRRAIEAVEADREGAQAAADLAHVMVAADTARAYADACAAGYQLKVAQQSVDLQGRFVKLTLERTRRGRGIAIDDSRARAQLELLRANLPPLVARQRTALYRLAVLTGEVPGQYASSLPAAATQCATPPRVARAIPVGDGAALLRRRPDVRQAERQLAGATARIGVATAELYPNISLGASFGGIGMMSQFGDPDTWKFSLGPLISWNLPSTGSARVHIAQAQAGTAATLARFDAVVLNALRETESALTVYARELDRNAALRAARDQSALAARQAAKLYQFGRADFLSTLDADRTLANAESVLAASDAALADDQVGLFLALGGGWESAREEKVAHH